MGTNAGMATDTLPIKAAEAVIGAVTGDLYKDVRSAVLSSVDYAWHIGKNCEKMKEAAEQLYAMMQHVQAKINWNKEMEPTKMCQLWIEKVKKIREEVETLESEYSKVDGFLCRSNLSKRMVEKYDEINRCLADGNAMELLIEKLPEPVIQMNAPKLDDKPSLYEVFKMITSFLGDANLKRIGVWGMVGVGKTAIMKNLNNSGQISKMFEIVIFATLPDDINEGKLNVGKEKLVRQPFQLAKEKLQQKIAQRLKVNLEGSTEIIASRISEKLKSRKYLLLLDNVWDKSDLAEVGICDNSVGSKVVLASRNRDVCRLMNVDEIVKVDCLSDAEAVALFREKIGQNINNSDFKKVAKLVVRHCSNLPLLIDKVAGFFKKKDQKLWWAGVRNFQKWPYVKFSGMEEVIGMLRFCFEELDEEEKKLCFLYGALHSEGCEIYTNYLVECCRAEGFVDDVDRGQIIVDDLIDVSFLEKGENKKCVRMNRVLRNMALKISSEFKDLKFLVRANEELQEPPGDEEWKEAKQISLMDNRLCSLPKNPNCTNLSTLFLQRNATLMEMPELFFRSMENLRVLDLHGTKLKSLPSLSYLTSLRALYLHSCDQLMELPSNIGALVHLEVLDIRGTGIYCLPVQIGCLPKLRCLRVSFSKFDGRSGKVEKHEKVLSNLSSLEELVIEVEAYNQWWINVVKDITEEVAALRKLTSLAFCFPDVECLKIFVAKSSWWKDPCSTFQFAVNHHYSTSYMFHNYFNSDFRRCLKYANGEDIDQAMSQLLAESYAFELISHKRIEKLSDFGIESINNLKRCIIEGCEEITTIIDAKRATGDVLTYLQEISIRNVPKLRSIWEGTVPAGSLAQLTAISLSKCLVLEKIFSRGMIQQLSNLQELRVEECPEIEEIVMESENNAPGMSVFPNLTTLVLLDLPKLRSLWKGNSSPHTLKSFRQSNCPLLTSLPF